MKLEELINLYFESLNETDLMIWTYIKNNTEKCISLSAEELAAECNVSRATILRFAKKLSLNSFADLKLYIKMHHQEAESKYNIDLNLICDNFHKVIEEYKKKDLSSICEKIYNAERIFVFGTGNAQKSEANELKRIFLTVGKCFYDLFDIGEVELLEDTLTDKDLMFIISLSGETESALKIAKKMRVIGMPVVSLTRLKDNSLAKFCDENLYVGTAFAKVIDNLNYETTTLFYILLEILFVKYMSYQEGKKL